MKWKDKLLNDIIQSAKYSDESNLQIDKLFRDEAINIHLAVFTEPFLSMILSGKKTMESRFSINNVIPYRRVLPKDIVLIKKSGGSIVGFFIVKDVAYFSNLTKGKVELTENQYGNQLAWDDNFLSNKSYSKYLSLISFELVLKINPIETNKSDKTGWSIVKLGLNNTLFENKSSEDGN